MTFWVKFHDTVITFDFVSFEGRKWETLNLGIRALEERNVTLPTNKLDVSLNEMRLIFFSEIF